MIFALLLAATFQSSRIGDFLTIPTNMPTQLTAAECFGTPQHTNTVRITNATRAAIASMYDAYLERCYFSSAGLTNGWNTTTFGPNVSTNISCNHGFRGEWVYFRETNGFRAFPDSVRLCETGAIAESHRKMFRDIIGNLGGVTIFNRGEAWQSDYRRVYFGSSLLRPQEPTPEFEWCEASRILGRFDETLMPLCALNRGDTDVIGVVSGARYSDDDLSLAGRLLLNACIGGTNELHTLIDARHCRYAFITNRLDDLIESAFEVGKNLSYTNDFTARLVPDTYCVSNENGVTHNPSTLATNSRILALANRTIEFPARRFDRAMLDVDYNNGEANYVADASYELHGYVDYENGVYLVRYDRFPVSAVELSNQTTNYWDNGGTTRGVVNFGCDMFRCSGTSSDSSIAVQGENGDVYTVFETWDDFWRETFPPGQPGTTEAFKFWFEIDFERDRVLMHADAEEGSGYVFEIVPSLSEALRGMPVSTVLEGTLSCIRIYEYSRSAMPTMAQFQKAYPAFGLGPEAWQRIAENDKPKLTVFANVLTEWNIPASEFPAYYDELDWNHSTKTQLYTCVKSTLSRAADFWQTLYNQRTEARIQAQAMFILNGKLTGLNLMSARSTIPIDLAQLDMSGEMEGEVGFGFDMNNGENDPLRLKVHYGNDGKVDSYGPTTGTEKRITDPIEAYIIWTVSGNFSKTLRRTVDELPSCAAETKMSEVIETNWQWNSLRLR